MILSNCPLANGSVSTFADLHSVLKKMTASAIRLVILRGHDWSARLLCAVLHHALHCCSVQYA